METITFVFQMGQNVSFNDRGKNLTGVINKRVVMDYEHNDTRNWIYYGIKVLNLNLSNDWLYFDKIEESQITLCKEDKKP